MLVDKRILQDKVNKPKDHLKVRNFLLDTQSYFHSHNKILTSKIDMSTRMTMNMTPGDKVLVQPMPIQDTMIQRDKIDNQSSKAKENNFHLHMDYNLMTMLQRHNQPDMEQRHWHRKNIAILKDKTNTWLIHL